MVPMELIEVWQWFATFGAGLLAGGINVIVGAGTLASFPILLLLGAPPLTATIANTLGIVPGSVAGVFVYRAELRARRTVIALLLPASVTGGIVGALVLLRLSSDVFTAVIPWLIGVGTLLVLVGPAIRARLVKGGPGLEGSSATQSAFPGRASRLASMVGAFGLGIYGGYFSAAQGILLIALLGVTTTLRMPDLNAIKNLTVAAVNVIAAGVFLVVSPELIDWQLVAPVAAGATVGGLVGGRFAKRLPAKAFRGFVVVVGVVTVVVMGWPG